MDIPQVYLTATDIYAHLKVAMDSSRIRQQPQKATFAKVSSESKCWIRQVIGLLAENKLWIVQFKLQCLRKDAKKSAEIYLYPISLTLN